MRIPEAWPYRMRAPQAAAFSGISTSAFYAAVEDGRLPKAVYDRSTPFWYRADLERALDALKDGAAGAPRDPFVDGVEAAVEAEEGAAHGEAR